MKIYEEGISPICGNFISSKEDISELFENRNLVVGDLDIKVGEFTDLYGWFSKPCRFCGFLNNNQAIFLLGQDLGSLFDELKIYYDMTFIITPTRIGKSYKAGTFRDSFLKKNKKGEYYFK